MINSADLIAKFRQAQSEGWGYIWGERGGVWTQAKQDGATREQTIKYGQKWVGKKVADCSGLFSWAFNQLGGYMYQGSNTMWAKYMVNKGLLTGGHIPKPGSVVFKTKGDDRYHVGLFVGNDVVIEAKGTSSGVVVSSLKFWHEWGEPKGVIFSGESEVPMFTPNLVILPKGKEGQTVNVRKNPKANSMVLIAVRDGTQVMAGAEITSDGQRWKEVKYNAGTGYMMSQYLQVIGSAPVEPPGTDTVTIALPHSAAQALFDALKLQL